MKKIVITREESPWISRPPTYRLEYSEVDKRYNCLKEAFTAIRNEMQREKIQLERKVEKFITEREKEKLANILLYELIIDGKRIKE